MNNTDDSFDDIQIEGEGGAFNEDAPTTNGSSTRSWIQSLSKFMFSTTSATRPAHSLFFKPLSWPASDAIVKTPIFNLFV